MPANPVRDCSIAAASLLLLLLAVPHPAVAVPSYARQTGVSCAACHLSYPELTSFGRIFKLNGYVQSIEEKIGEGSDNLSLNSNLPISAMALISYSALQRAERDTTNSNLDNVRNSNDSTLFPEQFSIFYAGRISPTIGTFLQVTYDGTADKFSMDNTDIRFVDSANLGGSILTYGLTLNNNPTVQDLWNTTPAWGYPFASSPLTPSPAASVQLDGALGQQVAGLGGYAGWMKGTWLYYAEVTLYKTALLGNSPPANTATGANVIKNYAPYERLAVEKNFGTSTWEFGLLGMQATYIPYGDVATTSDPAGDNQTVHKLFTNKFADVGADTQFQYVSSENQFSVKGLWLREENKWGSLSAPNHSKTRTDIATERLTFSYYRNRRFGFNLQGFSTTGTKDVFYGTRTDAPDTTGSILELVYTPWLNTRFSLAFTNFGKFNGSAKDYDGNGRNASDNNTTYLLAWLMF